MSGKAVIIHSLEQARAALAAAAELGVPVTLASAPGAAAYAGPAWFQEVVRLAQQEFPDVEAAALLDCGERAGDVMAALRLGLGRVRFTGRKAVAEKLASMAGQLGAELVTGRLDALDLRALPDPEAACRDWLSKDRRKAT
ncbi:MAG: class II fructose-bisphosphate aldolase [Rhodospirillales bacterium]|nr:class II fructose-bisphosphate aldolase [Rhodospirillales bacterium]